jgi:hypothetical protein
MGQTYSSDMRSAAYRHLAAAECLYEKTDRWDVAGYLFGIAAECALKQMMVNRGMRRLPEDQRRNDPFYAHFEELKTLLRDISQGRSWRELNAFVSDSSFMQHWDVSMRYSHGKDIERRWVEKWSQDARNVVGAMNAQGA